MFQRDLIRKQNVFKNQIISYQVSLILVLQIVLLQTYVYACSVLFVITFQDELFCVLRQTVRLQMSCDARILEEQKQIQAWSGLVLLYSKIW